MVLELIRRVRDRGLAVVLISHDMPHVFEIADRIHVARLGRRAAVLEPEDGQHERRGGGDDRRTVISPCAPVLRGDSVYRACIPGAPRSTPLDARHLGFLPLIPGAVGTDAPAAMRRRSLPQPLTHLVRPPSTTIRDSDTAIGRGMMKCWPSAVTS